jgi:hypothetical protein
MTALFISKMALARWMVVGLAFLRQRSQNRWVGERHCRHH